MTRNVWCAALGTALVAACGGALAQGAEKGFYAGASIGQSKFSGACDSDAGVAITNCDEKDTAWKIKGNPGKPPVVNQTS